MSKLGTSIWSSIGKSTTVIKSVPSPGSPFHTPTISFSCLTFEVSLCEFIFSCSFAIRLLSSDVLSISSTPEAKASSGMSAWFSSTGCCCSTFSGIGLSCSKVVFPGSFSFVFSLSTTGCVSMVVDVCCSGSSTCVLSKTTGVSSC